MTCRDCKRTGPATKQFALERAPISMCLQLNSLKMTDGDNVLNKKNITFNLKLNVSMLKYRLVAAISHHPYGDGGLYKTVGLTSSGNYYRCDDRTVDGPLTTQTVLKTNPYILFYELHETSTLEVSPFSERFEVENSMDCGVVKRPNCDENFTGFVEPRAADWRQETARMHFMVSAIVILAVLFIHESHALISSMKGT